MNDKNFGKKLKELRKSKGYTQQILAELVGIDEKHLSRLENGKYFPTYATLNKILNVLNTNINEMLGVQTSEIQVNNSPSYTKVLQILNEANSEDELSCYLEAIKITQKAINLHKQTTDLLQNS